MFYGQGKFIFCFIRIFVYTKLLAKINYKFLKAYLHYARLINLLMFENNLVLHKHADGEFPTAYCIVSNILTTIDYVAVFQSQRPNWRIPANTSSDRLA